MRRQKLILFLLIITVVNVSEAQRETAYRFYPVLRITDGDTFVIADGSRNGRIIRLTGVDAPESRNTGRKKKSEYGIISTRYLEKLIRGKRVRLEYDIDKTDSYGRTLAYVFLEDGTFVNAEMVRNGYANIMTVPPNVKYQDLFLKLERRARKRGEGLWGNDQFSHQ